MAGGSSFDMAIVSTSVPLIINAMEAEGILEDASSIPANQYGFKTHTIENNYRGATLFFVFEQSSNTIG